MFFMCLSRWHLYTSRSADGTPQRKEWSEKSKLPSVLEPENPGIQGRAAKQYSTGESIHYNN